MLKHLFPSVAFLSRVLSALVGLAVGVMFSLWSLESKPSSAIHRHTNYREPLIWATNHSVAGHIRKEVRVLCWIMTGPENHKTKAQHVRHTWGRHCNTLLFMTSQEDPELPGSIQLEVEEGRDNLWAKTKNAFQYVYDNHLEDADWFLKADDDSFVIMENLRAMLHPYPTDMPIFFGRKFILGDLTPVQGYMSGGASYVLSKEAVRRLIEEGVNDPEICYQGNGHSEDVELGRCMQGLRVLSGDSRDKDRRDRFFPLDMTYHLLEHHDRDTFWYYNYSYYAPISGPTAVPPSAISFHYISPKWLYVLDSMIYNVRTFGRGQVSLPIDESKLQFDEVQSKLRADQPHRDYSSNPSVLDQLALLNLD